LNLKTRRTVCDSQTKPTLLFTIRGHRVLAAKNADPPWDCKNALAKLVSTLVSPEGSAHFSIFFVYERCIANARGQSDGRFFLAGASSGLALCESKKG
jgi:hypothetical protein